MATTWKKFTKTTKLGYGKSPYGKRAFGDPTHGRNHKGNFGWAKRTLVATATVWTKRAITAFVLCFVLQQNLRADETTSLGLTKPDSASVDWDTKLNANMDVINAILASLQSAVGQNSTTTILNTDSLQSGSTFYVSSGVALYFIVGNIKSTGTILRIDSQPEFSQTVRITTSPAPRNI